MAHFLKPPGASSTGYDVDGKLAPGSIWRIQIPVGQSREVAVWGGAGLWIKSNNPAVVPNDGFKARNSGDLKILALNGRSLGTSMLEVGDGPNLWISLQVQVVVASATQTMARTGPQLGSDGPIPSQLMSTVKTAINIAWTLNDKPEFISAFNEVLSKLTGTTAPSNAYALALNKMILNLADTSTNAKVKRTIADDAVDVRQKALSGPTPAMSERNGRSVWLRRFSLEKGVNAVVANIFHEAVHLAGAPGDPVAELGIDKLHRVAGFAR